MHLTLFENVLWALGAGLKTLLCILVFYRRIYRRLSFFSLYAVLLVVEFALVWFVYREWGYLSRAAFYTYWYAALVVLLARGLVVAELCWTSLRTYPFIWSLGRKLLGLTAVVVLGYAVIVALKNASPLAIFVLTAERGLEISLAVVLVALLAFSTWYGVALGPVERSIVVGLGLYSCFQVVNNTFMDRWMSRYFHWWVSARVVAFDLAMLVWIVPLCKPLPPAEPGPTLISETVAARLLRELLAQMRSASEEMKRIARSKWK